MAEPRREWLSANSPRAWHSRLPWDSCAQGAHSSSITCMQMPAVTQVGPPRWGLLGAQPGSDTLLGRGTQAWVCVQGAGRVALHWGLEQPSSAPSRGGLVGRPGPQDTWRIPRAARPTLPVSCGLPDTHLSSAGLLSWAAGAAHHLRGAPSGYWLGLGALCALGSMPGSSLAGRGLGAGPRTWVQSSPALCLAARWGGSAGTSAGPNGAGIDFPAQGWGGCNRKLPSLAAIFSTVEHGRKRSSLPSPAGSVQTPSSLYPGLVLKPPGQAERPPPRLCLVRHKLRPIPELAWCEALGEGALGLGGRWGGETEGCCGPVGPRTMLGVLLEEAGQPGPAREEAGAWLPLDLQPSGPRGAEIPVGGDPRREDPLCQQPQCLPSRGQLPVLNLSWVP